MRIVVAAQGEGLGATVSPVFGRCATYTIVNTDAMDFDSAPNPAANAAGGAGIQAAQYVVSRGVEAVLAGNVGPNASQVLSAAGVDVYLVGDTTVQDAVKAIVEGRLPATSGPTVDSHTGSRANAGARTRTQEEEIAALATEAVELRAKLARIMDRINELEEEA